MSADTMEMLWSFPLLGKNNDLSIRCPNDTIYLSLGVRFI
jgi:hypothetical protein